MNTHPNKSSSGWLRGLFKVFAAGFIVVAFSGCKGDHFFAKFLGTEPQEILIQPGGDGFQTVQLEFEPLLVSVHNPPSDYRDQISFVLLDDAGNEIPQTDVQTQGGGIKSGPLNLGSLYFDGIIFRFKIVGQAPRGPVRVCAQAQHRHLEGIFSYRKVYYADVKVRFRAPGDPPAPLLTALEIVGGAGRLTAFAAQRGLPFEVEFTGTDFDATATFKATVMNQTYTATNPQSAGTGKVRATFDLPADAPSSQYRAYAEKNGVRSIQRGFAVVAEDFTPVLDGVFPNYVVANDASEERSFVNAPGMNFRPGSQMLLDAALAPISSGPVNVAPTFVSARFLATGSQRAGNITVNSFGRRSGPVPFYVRAAGFAGPRIVAVRPSTIAAGAATQVEIEWQNFRNNLVPALSAFPDASLAAATVLRNQVAPERTRSVAILTSAPGRTGGFSLAATTPDGLNTNLVGLQIEAPNPSAPLVQRAQFGHVQRGGPGITERFFGERLADVTVVDFSSPKVHGAVQLGSQTDTQFDMVITADADAPLTGDVLTTFVARTSGGKRSNPASYIVEPNGGAEPVIDELYPNWVARMNGGGGGYFFAQGANFTPDSTMTLTTSPPGAGQTLGGDPLAESTRILLAGVVPTAGQSVPTLLLSFTSTGGTSDPFNLAVLDSPASGPVLSATPTPEAYDKVTVQFVVAGSALVAGGATTVEQVLHDQGVIPEQATLLSSRYIPAPSSNGVNGGVIESRFALAAGNFTPWEARLALRRGDDLTSSVKDVHVRYQAQMTSSIVVETTTPADGDLHPNTTRTMTIRGHGFTGANGITFGSPGGITFSNLNPVSDTEITVDFVPGQFPVLTGNTPTNFQVVTPSGTSNSAPYVILP